ncbi:MAG: hypothetical protein ACXVGQ_15435 [Mycobacteriaceae bacterium]
MTFTPKVTGAPEKRRAEFDNDLANILNGWTGRSRWLGFRTKWCAQCGRGIHGVDSGSPSGRSKRYDALYCSNACRQAAYRARKAALKRLERAFPDP